MALGYGLGPIIQFERVQRCRWLFGLGAGISVGFVLLRATNLYGDPAAWTSHDSVVSTVLPAPSVPVTVSVGAAVSGLVQRKLFVVTNGPPGGVVTVWFVCTQLPVVPPSRLMR